MDKRRIITLGDDFYNAPNILIPHGKKDWFEWVSLIRICHDCGNILMYHEWIEIRCTLDNEDVTQTYCFQCNVKRHLRWLAKMTRYYALEVNQCPRKKKRR